MKNNIINTIKILKICIFIALALFAIHFLYYGIPEKFAENVSPSGKYIAEYYSPEYSIYAFLTVRMPYFIKVFNNEKNEYVYQTMFYSMIHHSGLEWFYFEEEEGFFIAPDIIVEHLK